LARIASKLGISVSTVSRAISNKEGVGKNLRNSIFEEARRIGYFSASERNKDYSPKVLGVIVPNIQNPFFLNFLKGIESVLFHRNYRFIMCNTDEDVLKEKVYIRWHLESKVAGIIAAPAFNNDGSNNISLYRQICKEIPIVLYDREFYDSNDFDSVITDNQASLEDAVRFLYEKGHRKIGILLSKSGNFCMRERLKGFMSAAEKFKLKIDDRWIIEDLYPATEIEERLKNFFLSDNKPTAVVATTHLISCNFLRLVRNKGLQVPQDISLIGYTDVIENDIFDPPLTTIKQPVLEIGQIASTTMLARLDMQYEVPSKVILKTQLIDRKSVRDLT